MKKGAHQHISVASWCRDLCDLGLAIYTEGLNITKVTSTTITYGISWSDLLAGIFAIAFFLEVVEDLE
jgi:hypothetical protein